MTRNLTYVERVLRIIIGAVLILAGLFADLSTWATNLAEEIGMVVLLTGAIGLCPLWWLLGVNTCARPPAGPA